MQFRSEAAASTYDKLNACLARDQQDFFAYPLRTIGNFVNVEWCRGKGADINCASLKSCRSVVGRRLPSSLER